LVSRDIDANGTIDTGLVVAVDAFVKLWFNCWKYSAVRRLDKTSVVPLFLYRADFKQQIVYPPLRLKYLGSHTTAAAQS